MDVFFETQSGYEFSIELGYWDTVLEIKQKIEKYQQISVSKQTLFFNGKILQDHLDIEQCEIFVNSRLQVLVSSSSPVNNQNRNNQEIQETEQSPPSNSSERIVPEPVQVVQETEQDSSVEVRSNQNKNDQVLKTEESPPLNITNEVIDNQDSNVIVSRTVKNGQMVQSEESLPSKADQNIQDSSGKGRRIVVYVSQHSVESEVKIPVIVNQRDNVKELRKQLVKFQENGRLNLPRGYFLTHEKSVINEERSFSWNAINPCDTIKIYPRNVTRGS